MPRRAFPDPTKVPAAAVTMAYKDYHLLENWVEYYGQQFGREHLYVLSHGGDPEHKKIADGCNVIYLPRDETMTKWDRLRWSFLSNFTNGLLRYYNWVICGDVDEIVVVDPDEAENLTEYLYRHDTRAAPKSLSPFGIEIIHNPEWEEVSLTTDGPLLEKRRIFRINANYAKPCVIRADVGFTTGGHANNHQPRHLDPHLYLIHLRYYDYDLAIDRLKSRADMRKIISADSGDEAKQPWATGVENYNKMISSKEPTPTNMEFLEFRKNMIDKAKDLHNGRVTFFGGGRSKELYRLPDRFVNLF